LTITQNICRIRELSGSVLPEQFGAVRRRQHEELVDDGATADLGVVHVLDQDLPRCLARLGRRAPDNHHVRFGLAMENTHF
jgi:hypothetical protein